MINGTKAEQLIFESIARYPKILTIESPFDLFKIAELRGPLNDMDLTLATASLALARARKRWEAGERP